MEYPSNSLEPSTPKNLTLEEEIRLLSEWMNKIKIERVKGMDTVSRNRQISLLKELTTIIETHIRISALIAQSHEQHSPFYEDISSLLDQHRNDIFDLILSYRDSVQNITNLFHEQTARILTYPGVSPVEATRFITKYFSEIIRVFGNIKAGIRTGSSHTIQNLYTITENYCLLAKIYGIISIIMHCHINNIHPENRVFFDWECKILKVFGWHEVNTSTSCTEIPEAYTLIQYISGYFGGKSNLAQYVENTTVKYNDLTESYQLYGDTDLINILKILDESNIFKSAVDNTVHFKQSRDFYNVITNNLTSHIDRLEDVPDSTIYHQKSYERMIRWVSHPFYHLGTQIPEFVFNIFEDFPDVKPLYVEVCGKNTYTSEDNTNLFYIEDLFLLFVSELSTEHFITFNAPELATPSIQVTQAHIQIPHLVSVMRYSTLTSHIYNNGGTTSIHTSPYDQTSPLNTGLESGWENLPNGLTIANMLEEKILEHMIKQINKIGSQLQEDTSIKDNPADEGQDWGVTDEIVWEYTPMENTVEISSPQQSLSRFDPERCIIYNKQTYLVKPLSAGQLPGYHIRPIIEELRKSMDFPDGYTLKKLSYDVPAIGWGEVSRILQKFFQCTIYQNKGSTHFRVKRVDTHGQTYNATILAPKRNKYSKEAAFGTISSMLRQLNINESLFWNTIGGHGTPEQSIIL